ncbi:MAG: PEP-CTERM sorting domain-containing protein [Phycisphaerales bacterium]
MTKSASIRVVGLLAGAGIVAGSASAGITDPGVLFEATNAQGTGSVAINLGQGAPLPGGGWQWILVGPPIPIMSGPNVIGTITQGSVTLIDQSPQAVVATTFAVAAGQSNTSFTISSALISFPTISNAQGRATAGITVTDVGGGGASVTGNRPNDSVFSAHYNGMAPGGTTFGNLISGGVTEPVAFGSETASENFPAGPGFLALGGNASDASTQWAFTVSGGDTASGTGAFFIVPAPASMALLSIAGGVMLRRRRA